MILPAALVVCRVALLAAGLASSGSDPVAQGARYLVDPEQSRVSIHLDTDGLLGRFGHRHLIGAPVASGRVSFDPATPEQNRVQLSFKAVQLQVLDSELAEDQRAEVQRVMQSRQVLHSIRHPLIRFDSRQMEIHEGDFVLRGHLTLRGTTRPLAVRGQLEPRPGGMRVKGRARFKQTLFGIRPVSTFAGAIRVKDELEVRFRLVLIPEVDESSGPRGAPGDPALPPGEILQ